MLRCETGYWGSNCQTDAAELRPWRLREVENNDKVWSSMDDVIVHQGDSRKLGSAKLRELAGRDIRFFSADGGHTEDVVFSDMKLAEFVGRGQADPALDRSAAPGHAPAGAVAVSRHVPPDGPWLQVVSDRKGKVTGE
jgi:hypothetical protein